MTAARLTREAATKGENQALDNANGSFHGSTLAVKSIRIAEPDQSPHNMKAVRIGVPTKLRRGREKGSEVVETEPVAVKRFC